VSQIAATGSQRGGVKLTEGQLFESSSIGLGEQEVDEANLKGQEAAVGDEVSPADVLETDGVDEGVEEAGKTAEKLEEGDTTRPLSVRPEFDKEGWNGASVNGHDQTYHIKRGVNPL
jgi:hypothetical protein